MSQSYFSSIIQPVKRILTTLMADDNFRETVTYKKYTGQGFDEAEGYTVNVYDSVPLVGVCLIHNKESVAASSSNVEVGDELFLFEADPFPTGASLKDLLVREDGTEWGVKGIDPILSLAVSVTIVNS